MPSGRLGSSWVDGRLHLRSWCRDVRGDVMKAHAVSNEALPPDEALAAHVALVRVLASVGGFHVVPQTRAVGKLAVTPRFFALKALDALVATDVDTKLGGAREALLW